LRFITNLSGAEAQQQTKLRFITNLNGAEAQQQTKFSKKP